MHTLPFLIRKFSDIGNTCVLQYLSPSYSLSDWSDLVTCHAIAGPGTLKALAEVNWSYLFYLMVTVKT